MPGAARVAAGPAPSGNSSSEAAHTTANTHTIEVMPPIELGTDETRSVGDGGDGSGVSSEVGSLLSDGDESLSPRSGGAATSTAAGETASLSSGALQKRAIATSKVPLQFSPSNFLREFVLMMTIPLSLPVFRLLYGHAFLKRRGLNFDICISRFFSGENWVFQSIVTAGMQGAVALYVVAVMTQESTIIRLSHVGHAVAVHTVWCAILSIKYSLVRQGGKILGAREWVKADRRTLMEQIAIARYVEGVDLSEHVCVFDPDDIADVRLRLKPALDTLPHLRIDEEAGTFPAELLLARIVVSATPAVQHWETEVLGVQQPSGASWKPYKRPWLNRAFGVWMAIGLPILVRIWEHPGGNLTLGDVFGHTPVEVAFLLVAGWPTFMHVTLTISLGIVMSLQSDIGRRHHIFQAFSSLLMRLDGAEEDPRFPALDWLSPQNLSSWFWTRRVAQALARDVFARMQLSASLVLFWIGFTAIVPVAQLVSGGKADLLLLTLSAQYASLLLVMVMSVVSMGGSINTEGLRNALTMVRARVRVRERVLALDRKAYIREVSALAAQQEALSAGGDPGHASDAVALGSRRPPMSLDMSVRRPVAATGSRHNLSFKLMQATASATDASTVLPRPGSLKQQRRGGPEPGAVGDGGGGNRLEQRDSGLVGSAEAVSTPRGDASGSEAIAELDALLQSTAVDEDGMDTKDAPARRAGDGGAAPGGGGGAAAGSVSSSEPPLPPGHVTWAAEHGTDAGQGGAVASASSSVASRLQPAASHGTVTSMTRPASLTTAMLSGVDKAAARKRHRSRKKMAQAQVARLGGIKDAHSPELGLDRAVGHAMGSTSLEEQDLSDPVEEAEIARALVNVVGLLDGVKDELQLFGDLRPLRLLGIPMGPPLLRALGTILVTTMGLFIRSLVLA